MMAQSDKWLAATGVNGYYIAHKAARKGRMGKEIFCVGAKAPTS
jgi:hypothetical protein